MLRLHGFPISNYYNMVKTALIEKGLDFEEVRQPPTRDDPAWLQLSPMGKIPALQTDAGSLAETLSILEYLEETAPTPALLPPPGFERARVRQIAHHAIYYIDLAARPLIPIALFGAPQDDAVAAAAATDTPRGLDALARIVDRDGWLGGGEFGMADIVTGWSVPLATQVCQKVCGIDLMADRPELSAWLARFQARPSVARCEQDMAAAAAARAAAAAAD